MLNKNTLCNISQNQVSMMFRYKNSPERLSLSEMRMGQRATNLGKQFNNLRITFLSMVSSTMVQSIIKKIDNLETSLYTRFKAKSQYVIFRTSSTTASKQTGQ